MPDLVGHPSIVVRVATAASPALAERFAAFIPQLSSSSPPPDQAALQAIIDHEACHLLLAHEAGDERDEAVLGSLTLVTFPIPTGQRAWIEDVVVDEAARGRGVGEVLNRFALDLAASLGAKTVDLTSRPSREAANRLYQRLGFVLRETNCYRYTT